ncbi:MAG TPA: hypothetical protein QGH10_02130, partial [Armatimonadota bacterium]|nr:hypothetical protein [Armatimonadota bacterium]
MKQGRALGCLLFLAAMEAIVAAQDVEFENFGTMVPDAGPAIVACGPGASGEVDSIYMAFSNAKDSWFMVVVDTQTGAGAQYQAPDAERMPKYVCAGPDGKMYVGSLGGVLYVFDPADADAGIVSLGKVCDGEGYLFDLTSGPDGRLYMGSYPGGKLLCYDPRSGEFIDYGRAADDEMYTQFVAPFSEDYAYIEVGVKRHRVVRMNLKTGAREEVALPDGFEDYPGHCRIWLGTDGVVQSYLAGEKQHAVIEGLKMRAITPQESAGMYGRLSVPGMSFKYDLDARSIDYTQADGETGEWSFTYADAAAPLYMLREGVDGAIYGSSYLPLSLFMFDPIARERQTLGNPFNVAGGQTYAILPVSPTQVYAGAYGDADFIRYDSTRPWLTVDGKAAAEGTNPTYLGTLGDEQNRPYDMLLGPDGFVYVATSADYGKRGGAVTKLDPETDTWTVYRNCVPDHAIGSLSRIAGDDRLIAGGSLAMATGEAPDTLGDAKLFLWDTTQDKVVYQTSPPVAGMQYILQLESTDEGILVGTCGRDYNELHLFAFDPKTREFIHNEDISELAGGYIYETSVITPPRQGKMLFTADGKICAIDASTFAVSIVAEYPGAARGGAIIESDGRRPAYY